MFQNNLQYKSIYCGYLTLNFETSRTALLKHALLNNFIFQVNPVHLLVLDPCEDFSFP
jgi:hypothetical protein